MNFPTVVDATIPVQKLTKLEKKWYQEYMKCFNATDALRKAYPDNKYTSDSERTIASLTKKAVFRKLNIDDNALMDMMGLTDEALLKKTAEGLSATRPIIVDGKVQGVADYATRHKYLETTFKLTGKLSDKTKIELTGENGGPLKIEMLAGIGFLNQPKNDNN